jgi:hypothetical protein
VTPLPRAVLVHRPTELQELLARHGTRGQAAFFLGTRGRSIEEVEVRHQAVQSAIGTVSAAIPPPWRRAMVERAELPRYVFEPGDIFVAIGQDGLVANLAKYIDGQIVIGINPEPGRNPGVLVPHPPEAVSALLATASSPAAAADHLQVRTMVEARTDDGQSLVALNEIFVGQPGHQTARYALTIPDGRMEHQASSGLIVSSGTGATGWCRSAWLERRSTLALPAPGDRRLAWFVREAWPSPATGTACTEGDLVSGQALRLTAESDQLILFGDGVEADAVPLSWGQMACLQLSARTLRLLR